MKAFESSICIFFIFFTVADLLYHRDISKETLQNTTNRIAMFKLYPVTRHPQKKQLLHLCFSLLQSP